MKVSTDSTRMKSQLYVMAWVGKVVRRVLESRPSSWVLLSQSLHSNPRRRGGLFHTCLGLCEHQKNTCVRKKRAKSNAIVVSRDWYFGDILTTAIWDE